MVKSRPKGAGQTCARDRSSNLDGIEDICAEYAYHRRATISGDSVPLGGCRVSTFIDREVTGNCPLGSAYGLGCLVEFGGHIEIVDGRGSAVDTIKADKGVDFEVSKVEVDVNGVESNQEVDEGFLLLFRYMFEKGLSPDVTRGEGGGNADIEPKGFGVNITNIDTTLVSEEDRITLTIGVDAYVELGVRWMRKERLDDKVVEGPGH